MNSSEIALTTKLLTGAYEEQCMYRQYSEQDGCNCNGWRLFKEKYIHQYR